MKFFSRFSVAMRYNSHEIVLWCFRKPILHKEAKRVYARHNESKVASFLIISFSHWDL